MLMSSTI